MDGCGNTYMLGWKRKGFGGGWSYFHVWIMDVYGTRETHTVYGGL